MRDATPIVGPAGGRVAAVAAVVGIALLLTGCGLRVPADPDGTEDRVRGGTLHAGVTSHPPWTVVSGPGEPTGSEVELIEEFAAELDADVEWTRGSEAALVDALERGEIDLAVGGFLDQTPWTERAAVTRWYLENSDEEGQRERHVMLTRPGENRFLVSLEMFLDQSRP